MRKFGVTIALMNKDFSQLANDEVIYQTAAALKANGMEALVVDTGEAAKAKILELIPQNEEVMTMSSATLDTIGVPQELNDSGKYRSVRKELMSMNRQTQQLQMNKLGSAPHYTVGSVNAVTADGKVIIASNTGSQLAAYAYGGHHVIWVVGAQKVTANLDEAMKRIYDYVLPLESERANKAYNITTGSFVSKLLIINREIRPGRITIILVKEKLGF